MFLFINKHKMTIVYSLATVAFIYQMTSSILGVIKPTELVTVIDKVSFISQPFPFICQICIINGIDKERLDNLGFKHYWTGGRTNKTFGWGGVTPHGGILTAEEVLRNVSKCG